MVLGITMGVLLVCLLLGAFHAYRTAFFVPVRTKDIYLLPSGEQYDQHLAHMRRCIDRLAALPYEEVTIRAFDGKLLFGRYYHVRAGAPVQLQFHGYRGGALRDLCGGTPFAIRSGHNVLLVDQRAHGRSGGKTITFGARERRDCQSWCRYAYERFGASTPLILSGVSMGASTVLMASAMELPETVKAVVADCPYTTAREIIGRVAAGMGLPRRVAVVFCSLGALLYGRFRLGSANALEAVRKTRLPLLLIHGEEDRFVPCDMSRQLRTACGGAVRLETFPGAAHGMSYMEDPSRYEEVVRSFLEEQLAR